MIGTNGQKKSGKSMLAVQFDDLSKQDGAISTLGSKPLKLIDQFTYFGSNISSTESDVNICIGKA